MFRHYMHLLWRANKGCCFLCVCFFFCLFVLFFIMIASIIKEDHRIFLRLHTLPCHTIVAEYYVIPIGVCPYVRAHCTIPIDNLSIHSWNFFQFCIYILSGLSGMELLMGKIRHFLTQLLPFFGLDKWFLACYSITVNEN